ncbi:MAG TPA: zinc metalloprotease HtpX [Microthrixaceae bacterium]|nr:zinc metalloprotease HtpX [Microthrixaceae bacterium]
MHNNLKTAVLLAGLGGFCMAIGYLFGGASGMTIGLIIGLAMCGGSYWFSDKLAIRSANAIEVTQQQMPQYHAIMADLCNRADLPMPRLYVSQNAQPNAFATGRSPEHAAVCVTEGLLQILSWREIEGVLAHELSHVRNRDILIGSVAAALAMGITFAASMARWALIFGGGGAGGRGDDRDGNPFAALLMMMLAPVAAMVIRSAISRSREFEADASAARMLGTGEPLATALEKLELGAKRIPADINPAEASAYIVNPLAGVSMANMFSTHPPVAERIARLRGGGWH